jgi:hypothetical protein
LSCAGPTASAPAEDLTLEKTPLTPRSLVRLQDRLVRLLGNSVDGRRPLVAGMLRRDASESTSYWLQLVVSVGIATLDSSSAALPSSSVPCWSRL